MGLFSKRKTSNHKYMPIEFATGDGTTSLLRFNVIGEASEHDQPIVINAINLFQKMAGAKIGDYPDINSALAEASIQQIEYYNMLDSLEDKEIKDELDRLFQHWSHS